MFYGVLYFTTWLYFQLIISPLYLYFKINPICSNAEILQMVERIPKQAPASPLNQRVPVCKPNQHSMFAILQGPLLLTWFNFNPSMEK